MATKFLEPGGDADFQVATGTGFWATINGVPVVTTDFVHGSHVKSIKYRTGQFDTVQPANGTLADAGSRISFYLYINALGNANSPVIQIRTTVPSVVFQLQITSAGIIQVFNDGTQIGTNGSTLSTGVWKRISIAYTVTSTTVNRIEVFVDGVSSNSITNATLSFTGSSFFFLGNINNNATFDIRTSDHYADNSAALTDPGNIWVTAKRPNANGTTNGFTTQIGAGGSGYGTGHSPQVNERALNNTNGWSIAGAGSAITEEYNIEGKGTGDLDLSTATIVDYLGWVDAKALASETGKIIVNNVQNNIALTSTETLFTQIAGSSVYPAGTGTDIGIITSTTVTTVSLYECGIIVAYIPAATSASFNSRRMLVGIG